eukprot:391569_1
MGNKQASICNYIPGSKVKQEILLHGFIRETAKAPDAIIELCLLFYSIPPANLFVTARYCYPSKLQLIDIKQKKVIDLKINKSIKQNPLNIAACYVPDISLNIKTNKSNSKHLDGFIGLSLPIEMSIDTFDTISSKTYPTVVTFDSTMNCDVFAGKNEIHIKPHQTVDNRNARFMRTRQFLKDPDFIYHDTAKSVIYVSKGGIYSMPLNGIDISEVENPKFDVVLLQDIKSEFAKNSINDIRLGQIHDNNHSKCAVMVDDNNYPFY